MITHTTAIILKSVDYQESSKIITVLSKAHGKIALIARGSKKPKNKLSGLIEIGNILDVVYYYKPTRNVQNLTEASIQFSSLNFRRDFQKASILFATLELVNQLVHEYEENENMFNFLSDFIIWLASYNGISLTVFCYVQLRCAELMGFNLTIDKCDSLDESYFDITHGWITCKLESELSYKLSLNQTHFLTQALTSKSKKLFQIWLSAKEVKQLIHHFDAYFKYHIEGYQDRRSDSIFEQILKDSL